MTFTTSWVLDVFSFLESVIAPYTAKPSTSTSGISVQMISSGVLPWIGSPSDMSPGLALNFHIM